MLTNPLGQIPRYASFWERLFAHLIDVAFLSMIVLIFHLMKVPYPFLLLSLLFWIYFTGLESSSWQATIGKTLVGLKVTDEAGNRIGFGRANARFWSRALSSILYIGYIMIAFTKKKQGLHDKIARTLVLNAKT